VIAAITPEREKLPVTVLGKGTTPRCLTGLELPDSVNGDFAKSGWTKTDKPEDNGDEAFQLRMWLQDLRDLTYTVAAGQQSSHAHQTVICENFMDFTPADHFVGLKFLHLWQF
jgi:hypothetical protein